MVQFVNIRELKNHISKIIRHAQRGDVIVTSRGKPKAVLHAVSEEDIEDYLLGNSPKFQKGVDASYKEYQKKKGASLEKLILQTEKQLKRVQG